MRWRLAGGWHTPSVHTSGYREATFQVAGQVHKTWQVQLSQLLPFLCYLQEKGNFTSLSAGTVTRQTVNVPSSFFPSSCSWPSFPQKQCLPTIADKTQIPMQTLFTFTLTFIRLSRGAHFAPPRPWCPSDCLLQSCQDQ